jgi:hypothetical protein
MLMISISLAAIMCVLERHEGHKDNQNCNLKVHNTGEYNPLFEIAIDLRHADI